MSEQNRATTVRQFLRETTGMERVAVALSALLMLAPLVPWQVVEDWVG
jgi:hypothetical protein